VKNEVNRDAFPPVGNLTAPSFFDATPESGPFSSFGVVHIPKNLSGPVSSAKGVSTFGLSKPKKPPVKDRPGSFE
jgi:hypothetical protein